MLPYMCRMLIHPGGPPVVADSDDQVAQPGTSIIFNLIPTGQIGTSIVTFEVSGANGQFHTENVTIEVQAPPRSTIEPDPGAQTQPARVGAAGSNGGSATHGEIGAEHAARPTQPAPPPAFALDLIECQPTAGGATSVCQFAVNLPGNAGLTPSSRYNDLSLRIEPLRHPKDMHAFGDPIIPRKPLTDRVWGQLAFLPPRAGSYQAWLVLRGIDDTGHAFETRTVLIGEAPRNAKGFIDKEAISTARLSDDQAIGVINAAWQIMRRSERTPELVARSAGAYQGVLESLAFATGKTHPRPGEKRTPEERLRLLEGATGILDPLADRVAGLLEDEAWVDAHYTRKVGEVRRDILFAVASQRVEDAQLTKDGDVVEAGGEGDFEREKATLRHAFKEIAETAGILNEQVLRTGEKQIEEQVEHMQHGGRARWGTFGSLTQVQATANFLSGILGLSDEEMWKELSEKRGAARVGTALELTNYFVKSAGSMTSLTASFAWALAKCTGDTAMEAAAAAVAQKAVVVTGKAVAIVELAHDVTVLLSDDATGAQKEDATADLLSTGTWGSGQLAAETGAGKQILGEATAETVGVAATSASLALYASYQELKFIASQYGVARLGLARGMSRAMRRLNRDADDIAKQAARLAKAGILYVREPDAELRKAYRRVRDEANRHLAGAIEYLINDFQKDIKDGGSQVPANWSALRDEFKEFDQYRNVTDPAIVPRVAKRILDKANWCNRNYSYLVEKTAGLSVDRPGECNHATHEEHE